MFWKRARLKIEKYPGKARHRVFFIKVARYRLGTSLKKDSGRGTFLGNFKTFRNNHSVEQIRIAASVIVTPFYIPWKHHKTYAKNGDKIGTLASNELKTCSNEKHS